MCILYFRVATRAPPGEVRTKCALTVDYTVATLPKDLPRLFCSTLRPQFGRGCYGTCRVGRCPTALALTRPVLTPVKGRTLGWGSCEGWRGIWRSAFSRESRQGGGMVEHGV
eukprot:4430528-Prymnesium_polylepis.1